MQSNKKVSIYINLIKISRKPVYAKVIEISSTQLLQTLSENNGKLQLW